jgi:hypothetical protein
MIIMASFLSTVKREISYPDQVLEEHGESIGEGAL